MTRAWPLVCLGVSLGWQEKVLTSPPSPNSEELDDLVTQLRERQFDAITQVIDNQTAARAPVCLGGHLGGNS